MGKPRMIILIRHGQSEGNRNRAIHQIVPDHRVKLTEEGWAQAHDAGRRLRSMLRPDDTLQFYTSPYRRTRETTEGILSTLTSDEDSPTPFPRHTINVWEEPRIREQDFGNFQPCSAAMERMWQERADYGHFFYRIPNGESAADAYDRVSGFNETLWRQFGDGDFPSVCVLVTHGLMSRIFLMKWYHWSVEYFEDLRNVNHCEFIVMKRGRDSGKYILQNQLRTWSDLKREAAKKEGHTYVPPPRDIVISDVGDRRWGGCPEGCTHESEHEHYLKTPKRKHTIGPSFQIRPHAADGSSTATPSNTNSSVHSPRPDYIQMGRDFGGTSSGAPTPWATVDQANDKLDYGFPASLTASTNSPTETSHRRGNSENAANAHDETKPPSQEEAAKWARESGMCAGAHADALGDQVDESETLEQLEIEEKEDKSVMGSVY